MASVTSNRGWIANIAILFLFALISLYTGVQSKVERSYPQGHPIEGSDFQVTPSTFAVESRRSFRVKAVRDFDPSCGRISAVIPDLAYSQEITRKELLDGVQGELNPSRTGTFEMTFSCNGNPVGSAPLSVVIGAELGPSSADVRWVLSTGKPIYREDSFYSLPVVVSAEQKRGTAKWIAAAVSSEARFELRDQNGQLKAPPEIIVDRNTAVSDPVLIPFSPGADFDLVAFSKADGKASNHVKIDWKQQGPQLTLVALPGEVSVYAAPISTASAHVYLASEGFRVRPAEALDILVTSPPVIKSDPSDRLSLTRDAPVATYKASAGTSPGTAKVEFQEPRMNVPATILVHILSPVGFLIAATLAGLIGVIVARGSALFSQKTWLILLELFSAAAAAFLLYSADLQGWLKPVGLAEFTLSYLAAMCIGMVGGYLGLAVFKGIAALFKLVP